MGVFVTPNVSLFMVLSAIEPLRTINRLLGHTAYNVEFLSADGEAVITSNGLTIPVVASSLQRKVYDLAIICISYLPTRAVEDEISYWLRLQNIHDAALVGLDLGVMALARTGLLEGYKAAVLWEVLPSAREEFANLDLTEDLFSIDRNRMTAGGVLATLDMMMVYIHAHHGRELTVAIANELTMTQVRSGNEPQTMRRYTEPWAAHAKLAKAIEEMKVNLEAPLSIDTIASLSGISCTQLRRLSEKYLETTPSRFYLTLRLRKSRELVLYSKMRMTVIALACGFSSSSTFARAFQAHFHISASEYRRRHQSNLSRPYIDPPEQNIVRDGLFPFNDEDAPI